MTMILDLLTLALIDVVFGSIIYFTMKKIFNDFES